MYAHIFKGLLTLTRKKSLEMTETQMFYVVHIFLCIEVFMKNSAKTAIVKLETFEV